MIILLFGNIGSGKTKIANFLQEKYDIKYYSIDDYRKQYSSGSKADEDKIKKMFVDEIKITEKLILIETLGIGKLNDMLFEKFKQINMKINIFILYATIESCVTRIKNRIWDIPFPWSIDKTYEIIVSTHKKLFDDKCYLRWQDLNNSQVTILNNEVIVDFERNISFVKSTIDEYYDRSNL